MKLKLLTLLLTIGVGLFALGTNVNAAEKSNKVVAKEEVNSELGCPKTDADNIALMTKALSVFCTATSASDTLKAGCKDFCSSIAGIPGTMPSKANVQKCGAAAKIEKSKIGEAAVTVVLHGVCYALCSGKGTFSCESCQWPNTKQLCGTFCCNFPDGESTLGKCLTSYGTSCAKY